MTDTEKKYWQEIAVDFWKEIEKEAAELEVPVDYYMEEFFTSWHNKITLNRSNNHSLNQNNKDMNNHD